MISRTTTSAPFISSFVLELNFSGDARQRGVNIADAGKGQRFAVQERAALCVRDSKLHSRDGEALRDAGRLSTFLSSRATKAICSTIS